MILSQPTLEFHQYYHRPVLFLPKDREGAEVLEREGGPATQQRLSEMAHSLNEGLATYAAAIVLRMSELREERQQALNTPPNPVASGAPMQQWIQPPPPPPPPNAMGIPPGPNAPHPHPHHSQGLGGPPPHHAPHLASPAAVQGAGQAPAAADPFLDLPPGGGSMLNYLQQGTPPQGPPGPPTPQQQAGPGPAPPPHTGLHAGRAPPRSIDSSGYVSPAAGYAAHYGADPNLQPPPWVYEGPPAHM